MNERAPLVFAVHWRGGTGILPRIDGFRDRRPSRIAHEMRTAECARSGNCVTACPAANPWPNRRPQPSHPSQHPGCSRSWMRHRFARAVGAGDRRGRPVAQGPARVRVVAAVAACRRADALSPAGDRQIGVAGTRIAGARGYSRRHRQLRVRGSPRRLKPESVPKWLGSRSQRSCCAERPIAAMRQCTPNTGQRRT
jgi:hypothetical protein